jgi:hypothetical protein
MLDNKTIAIIIAIVVSVSIIIELFLLFKHKSVTLSIYFAIFGIVLVTILFFYFAFSDLKPENKERKKNGVILPFAGRLVPNWSDPNSPANGLSLVKMGDDESFPSPSLVCDKGYEIDIIAAYLEVDDPFNECSNIPDALLQVTCGTTPSSFPDKIGDCKTDKDCAVGTSCNSTTKKCLPLSCKNSKECGGKFEGSDVVICSEKLGTICKLSDSPIKGLICASMTDKNQEKILVYVADPKYGACMACINPSTHSVPTGGNDDGVCMLMPDCMNVNNGLNNTCSANGKHKDIFKCRPRDASAYLANHCNGKEVCLGGKDTWLPNKIGGAFGPLPCQIEAGSDDYRTLPINIGWTDGATPKDGVSSSPGSYNQGYKVHGIYSCILKKQEESG